jgi:polysaccharide deacetylase family protein (PEP-CTERM system associated)
MIHALTIDVEDYHNVMDRDWLGKPSGPPTRAVVENTSRILRHLAERDIRATFFVLGEVAETYPDLIRQIDAAGHELGVHGYRHQQVFKLTPETFRREVGPARKLMQELTGQPVRGHRAPAFSITRETCWALEVLVDEGFDYDSSIFPINGRRYGWPGFPLDIHQMTLDSGRTLIEAPLSVVSVLGRRFPVCGGGYIRHFPAFLSQWALRRVQRHRPAIVYTHPYEFELDVPMPDVSGLDARRAEIVRRHHRLQMRNRPSIEGKFTDLLDRFQFAPLCEIIESSMGDGVWHRAGTSCAAAFESTAIHWPVI